MKAIALGCVSVLAAIILIPILVVAGTALIVNPRTPSETDYAASRLLAEAPPALEDPTELKLVTFNIQLLAIVGQNRPARMVAIAKQLAVTDPDIVCFQEAFIGEERELLIEGLGATRLQYHEYFPGATVGSGLMISSAYPIEETYFHRFTVANPWYRLWEGDWWAGKGVALARIALPEGGYTDVYNTHAQAGYGRPEYHAVRREQMQEMIAFIKATHVPSAPAFVLGDFNSREGSGTGYDSLVEDAGLIRVMTIPSAIDHIFARESPAYTFETLETLELTEFEGVRLSDHNGYQSTVRIVPATETAD